MREIWKEIDGEFDINYFVSNLGRIKSNIKLLRQSNVNGYKVVGLRTNNKFKQYKVHRLVAQVFIPNPDNLPQVNHKDENKTNNQVDNLEWCTALYNNTYGSRPDRIRQSNSRRGCPKSTRDKIQNVITQKQGKAVTQFDMNGNEINRFISTKEAERITGIPHNVISYLCSGKKKCFKNTTFKYTIE